MRNARPRVVVALGAVLALVALAALAGQTNLAEVPSVAAQAPPAQARNIETTLYTTQVQWRTVPSARVTGELRDASDQAIAVGTGLADDEGNVTVVFRGGRGPNAQPGQQAVAAIRPGFEIRLTPAGGDTVAATVPELGVGASTAGDRVLITGPAGAQVGLVVEHTPGSGGTLNETVTLGAAGTAEYAMPGGTSLDPEDYGWVSLETTDDNTFIARFDVLVVDVTLGARQASGVATLGTDVEVVLTDSDGSAKGSGTSEILDSPSFDLPAGGGGGGPRAFGPIAAGDTIRVSQTGGLAGTDGAVSGVIPNVTVGVNLASLSVEGTGPADTELKIVVTSPYGETVSRTTTTDATGAYSADLSDVRDFGRGWTVAATFQPVPGLRVSVYQTVEQIRVGVHQSLVTGTADPGRAITITVRSAAGVAKGTQTVRSNGSGQYQATFTGNTWIEFGDSVEVELVFGDPISVYVARVSAETDPLADTVSGEAPAGTSVRVSHGSGNDQTAILTTADQSGRYVADFGGTLDLAAPMSGDLVVRLPSGHELFTGWAAVQMTMELGQSFLTGNGPVGRSVSAELLDSDMQLVATGSAEIFGGGGAIGPNRPVPGTGSSQWDLDFEDTLGALVAIAPGDTVRATVGDDHFEVKVPPLSGVAFVADDLVNGSTTAGRALTLRVQHVVTGENTYVDLVADADGNFTHQFGEEFDLQHNDAILLTTLEAGHRVNSRFFVPGLRLDLDTATLVGSWRPDTVVAYELRGSAGVRASGTTTTNAEALFSVVLQSPSGARAVPQEGDTLTVEALSGAAEAPLVMEVPRLTIEWDTDTDYMGGETMPGGHLTFVVEDVIGRGLAGPTNRRVDPEIEPDGTYVAQYVPAFNLEPGIQMRATYRLPSGHLVYRTRYAPLINVQSAGANICGFSAPRSDVDASLHDAGGAKSASAWAVADYNSRFAALMYDAGGDPVPMLAGQTVRADLGGEDVEMEIPPLTVKVDWETGRVEGEGPPRSTFMVLWPARGCLDTSDRQMMRGRTDPQGQFTTRAVGIDPGQGFEVAYYVDDGHRVYTHVFRSLGQIYVHTDKITGRALPLSPVSVELLGADGAPRGKAAGMADSDGLFELLLRGDAGQSVTSAPGDTVMLAASGENPDIVVEDLRLEWTEGGAIAGYAPPNREVEIALALDGMAPARFTLTSSDSGEFRLDEGDLPPRSEWGLDDVRGVRAVLETEKPVGHEIVYEMGEHVPDPGTGPGPNPTPQPPGDRTYDIYAPRVAKSG
ncbi:MAG: hypothetical protein ACK2T6_05340 [Anaerolineae bacterium]